MCDKGMDEKALKLLRDGFLRIMAVEMPGAKLEAVVLVADSLAKSAYGHFLEGNRLAFQKYRDGLELSKWKGNGEGGTTNEH
jgi:hypothetical protein